MIVSSISPNTKSIIKVICADSRLAPYLKEVEAQSKIIYSIFCASMESSDNYDFSGLSPLLNGLKTRLQNLSDETKAAQELCRNQKETLNAELGKMAESNSTLSQQHAINTSECEKLQQSVNELRTSCNSLGASRDELKKKIREIDKIRDQIKNKRWNTLRDLLPLHGLASGLLIERNLKSALLRSIPGYSVVVGIKSLVNKEYGVLSSQLAKLEATLAASLKDLQNKEALLSQNKSNLSSKELQCKDNKSKLDLKSREIRDQGIKIDNLNNAYVVIGTLINKCDQLEAGTRLVTRKCDRQKITTGELSELVISCTQFQLNFGKLLQIE